MTDFTGKKQEIINAFHFRHATKEFDPVKKISDDDFRFILEAGRLSPSSVGFEPWKFVIIQNKDFREQLRSVSWGAQRQLPTASHFVIILARRNVRYDSEYVLNLCRNVKKMNEEALARIPTVYRKFQESDLHILDNERTLFDWSCKQTYIALANMMTAAALIGIDSCPIEGFDFNEVHKILDARGLLENGNLDISVMLAFGYRAKDPHRPKTRQNIDDIVTWVD